MSVFSKAIDLLREHGWRRNNLGPNRESTHCALGALYFARNENAKEVSSRAYESNPHTRALAAAIREQEPEWMKELGLGHASHEIVFSWNDKRARDVDDVIHMLKLADEKMEAKKK